MIFEVRKGRECSAALQTSIQAISALEISEGEKGRLITLQADQLKNYALLDQNWSLRLTNQSDLFMIEKSNLKQKVKRRNKFIAGQGLVIAILLALIVGG